MVFRRLAVMKLRPINNVLTKIFVGFLACANLVASDLRPPLMSMEGPLRFVQEAEVRDESSLKFWATIGTRQASQAFMEHGFSSVDYSNLIFNKSQFRVSDIFTDSYVSSRSESYLALLRTARISTNASYAEKAIVFGLQWMYPVYEDRGRFGVRVRVPLKSVEIEREDVKGLPGGAQLEDLIAVQQATSKSNGSGSSRDLPSVQTRMMRFDFAEALTQSSDLNLVFNFDAQPKMSGDRIISGPNSVEPQDTAKRRLAVVYSPVGDVPQVPEIPTNVAVVLNATEQIPSSYLSLPADGKIAPGKVYVFDSTPGKYRNLLDDNAPDANVRRANQLTKETMWLVPFGYENSASAIVMAGTEDGGAMKTLKELSGRVTENVYQWLLARGYEFESEPRQGLGDVSIEGFYQHDLVPNMSTEFLVGVGIPFDRDNQFYKSPYKARLGNGGHWEVYFGGGVGSVFKKMINLRVHGNYGIVLPAEEEINATFKGTLIKAIGPKQEATIDWKRATVNFDCTLFHPDSKTCSAVLGYQFHWRSSSNVSFKNHEAETWLGKKYNVSRREFEPDLVVLDSSRHAINTNSIAHRLRMEVSLRIGSYCEMLFGGAYTIAGRYVARDLDTHFGVHLTF
ncbi:hypothetical protein FJ366_00990 [Candidatus Dependentiae bacterium]|nr:hypothetical protein [Candidatus Dependentiae bacterium]